MKKAESDASRAALAAKIRRQAAGKILRSKTHMSKSKTSKEELTPFRSSSNSQEGGHPLQNVNLQKIMVEDG